MAWFILLGLGPQQRAWGFPSWESNRLPELKSLNEQRLFHKDQGLSHGNFEDHLSLLPLMDEILH